MSTTTPSDRPVWRVVRGQAGPEELAALVAVLTTLAACAPTGGRDPARPGWADPARALRRPVYPGPGAWRASAAPGA